MGGQIKRPRLSGEGGDKFKWRIESIFQLRAATPLSWCVCFQTFKFVLERSSC